MAAADDPARFTHPGTAAEPARAANLSAAGLAVYAAGQSVEQLLDALMAAGLLPDAVAVLARALPKREAVWWAVRCAQEAPRPPADGPTPAELTRRHETAVAAESAARAAAGAWCSAPTDDRRRAAFTAAEPVMDTPSGLAAVAAFFAEGSLAPADCPAVTPPADACAAAVAGAVLLAAVRSQPEQADEKRTRFIATGRQVNAGVDRWPAAPPATAMPAASVSGPSPKPPPPPPVRRSYY